MTTFDLSEVHTIKDLLGQLEASKIDHDLGKVEQAFDYASQVHAGELRKNGDPRSYHLLTTAAYLARLNLDTTSVICGLLHEVLEKDKTKLTEIDNKFGTEVAFIIDGLTNVKYQSEAFDTHNEDPANFRHLIMNSVDDIRVLLVRLANKLHNVQSLDVLKPDRKQSQANKILLIYAPLCEYLGLGQFQSIFETLAFKALKPEEYKLISDHIAKLGKDLRIEIDALAKQLSDFGNKYNLQVHDISSRTKNVYSTYRKLKRKCLQPGEQITEEHLAKIKDLLGIRVIVETVEQCYVLLGLIHENWKHLPEEFDDYISKPKISGYKSIHTVINFGETPVEIQIRTSEMHEYNEFGPASHIAYKLQSQNNQKADHTWTKDLLKWKQGKLT
ncbi:bifunctional (p)ppGpp synthetase/guanosine-3',5'-bis(diphosphate) 3'-pyrophosphohydrolase, partial [Candidatus Dojkabacteria bacterium]|nr:bifunctional (p)ppGpp synthetase/guanosine-3',5'-bis(diphosphate) 3'-pyrophosphohydrolase [Candidatus Dojkabacteria bacterium]